MDLGRVVVMVEIEDSDLVGQYTGSKLRKVGPLSGLVTVLR